MDLLEGEDLADVLRSRGPMPAHEVIGDVVHACDALAEAHACDALAEAHARGIVHRDLKPANLFFARRANGRVIVKVLDFGISKATASFPMTEGLTGTTALMGTPHYMSPEQLREARNVDGRSDIWALGITMYELLASAPPFVADALRRALRARHHDATSAARGASTRPSAGPAGDDRLLFAERR